MIKIKASDCKTSRYDMADYLHTEKDIEEYLKYSFESGDEKQISRALAVVARAKGLLRTSKQTGLSRSNLYKTFINNEGSPSIATVSKLINYFGYKLSITSKGGAI